MPPPSSYRDDPSSIVYPDGTNIFATLHSSVTPIPASDFRVTGVLAEPAHTPLPYRSLTPSSSRDWLVARALPLGSSGVQSDR